MRKKVVILTALGLEFSAVRAYLTEIKEEVHEGTIYEKGLFKTGLGKEDWEVILVEMGMGNTSAALAGQRAISEYHPDLLLMVGIAGGLKDVKPGDVVAGRKIYFYESGRVEEHFKPRAEVKEATFLMEQRARAVARNKEWQRRIISPKLGDSPDGLVGVIAAGEKILGSTESETWKLLHNSFGDAQAVEMEGYGALLAARNYTSIEAMVIRGISDTLDNKGKLDKQHFQPIAASHASAFAFEMLAKLADDNVQMPGTAASPAAVPLPPLVNATSSTAQAGAAVAASAHPVRIFYSYAHDDKTDSSLIEGLKKQLTVLRHQGKIQEWDRLKIIAGTNVVGVVSQHLQEDDIFVLGISPSYIGSIDYNYYAEIIEIMNQRASRKAVVIPVLLRQTFGIEDLPTGELMILPRNQKPVVDDRETALRDIASEIRTVVNQRLGSA